MTDVFSWGDSSPEDPFDDDSWMSEPESLCNNWRGWKKTTTTTNTTTTSSSNVQNNHLGLGTSSSATHSVHHHQQQQSSSSGCNHNHHHLNPNSSSNGNYYGGASGSASTAGTPSTTSTTRRPQPNSAAPQQSNGSSPLTLENGANFQQANFVSDLALPEHVPSLTELSARVVAHHISFEVVERVCSPVPEQLQLRIAYWSFPDNEEDIRLYSCLANGSADEFQKGETLYRCRSVQYPLQIGFHLSATVVSPTSKTCTVAVTFDRCRITSCNCTCASPSSWCSHVVAVCLHRIYQPNTVRLRAPVSESLTRLSRDQLQKFAQYLISESPQQILPTAQRLLDDLLLNEHSDINKVCGAPDPTAGAAANEQTKWCLDEIQLHGNIRKIVIKLCIPSPMVYSDVNYLSSAAPPAAAEWSSLLRPLRGREPEGLWNLLSIVREMLRRHDRNAIPLLKILTEELLSCDQILMWWFATNVSLHRGYIPNTSHNNGSSNSAAGGGGGGGTGGASNNRSMHSNIYATQHACCSLCDEIAILWRLVTLNPGHSPADTQALFRQLQEYHLKTLTVIYRFKPSAAVPYQNGSQQQNQTRSSTERLSDMQIFSGFKPAMISCLIDWDSYPIPGVTYQRSKNRSTSITGAGSGRSLYEQQLNTNPQKNSHNCGGGTGGTSTPSHAITSTMVSLRLNDDSDDAMMIMMNNHHHHQNWHHHHQSTSSSNFKINYHQSSSSSSSTNHQGPKNVNSSTTTSTINADVQTQPSTSGIQILRDNQQQQVKDNESEDSGNQDQYWDPQERWTLMNDDQVSSDDDEDADDDDESSTHSAKDEHNTFQNDRKTSHKNQNVVSHRNNDNDDDNGAGQEQQQPQHQNDDDDNYQIYIFNNNNDDASGEGDAASNNKQSHSSNDNQNNKNNSEFGNWEPVLISATKIKPIEDPFEILFARAEALYAHGYVNEACKLSVRLAEQLLNNPPDLQLVDVQQQQQNVHNNLHNGTASVAPSTNGDWQQQQQQQQQPLSASSSSTSIAAATAAAVATLSSAGNNQQRSSHAKRINRNRFNPVLHQISLLTSATLSKAAFLCQVLSETESSHLLAFRVGLFGLELVRPPASTKALEVKLAHQEQELVNMLKRIPLCPQALTVLREKAEHLRDGRLATRGEALLPLSLASYIFEALTLSNQVPSQYRLQTDERLVFDAAVAAIGLKAKVSEAEHPLLCEGTRRQRGDLALNLLVYYKDNKKRLDLIMEKLLDQDIHPIFNSGKKSSNATQANQQRQTSSVQAQQQPTPSTSKSPEDGATSTTALVDDLQAKCCISTNNENGVDKCDDNDNVASTSSKQRRSMFHKQGKTDSGSESTHSSSSSSTSSSASSSACASSDSILSASAVEKKVVDTIDKTNNNNNNDNCNIDAPDANVVGSNGSDSNADESNASDPTASSNQMDGLPVAGSSSSTFQPRQQVYPPANPNINPITRLYNALHQQIGYPIVAAAIPQSFLAASSAAPNNPAIQQTIMSMVSNFKPLRYKGKRHYPVIPNQPSEASAHFMFELAKTLLCKAGGNNTTVLFTQPPSSQNCRAPHRLLHMCAFQIGLYALGLHNAVSRNWLSRTYSSHVSWITMQAMEIGHQAIKFLIDTWEGHLTPSEVASLADRASRNQEPMMVKAAAELALSCLPHAHALTPSEIQRALIQCREQSTQMLERACLAVEQAAQGGGVYPEVLFDVARKWYDLFKAEKNKEYHDNRQHSPLDSTESSNESCSNESRSYVPTITFESSVPLSIVRPDYLNNQQSNYGNATLDPSTLIGNPNSHISNGAIPLDTLPGIAGGYLPISQYPIVMPAFQPADAAAAMNGALFGTTGGYMLQTPPSTTGQQQPTTRSPAGTGASSSSATNNSPFVQRTLPVVQQQQSSSSASNSSSNKSPYGTYQQYGHGHHHHHHHHHHSHRQNAAMAAFVNQVTASSGGGASFPLYGTAHGQSFAQHTQSPIRHHSSANYHAHHHQAPGLFPQPYNFAPTQSILANVPIAVTASNNGSNGSPSSNATNSGSIVTKFGPAYYFGAFPAAAPSQQSTASSQAMSQQYGSANATAMPGSYSFVATPLNVVRTQMGLLPQGLVAGASTPASSITPAQVQTFRFISMDQLTQPFTNNNAHSGQSSASGSNASYNGQSPSNNNAPQSSSSSTTTSSNNQPQQTQPQTILGPRQLGYMHATYRVGMLAMDTLARRVHDDRPQARYARNPSYGEDVKWLLFIAKQLGSHYVQEFCLCTLTAVASPFVLYDIILDAAEFILQSAPPTNSAYIQTIRSQILNPLIQKCQQMFTSCIYFQIMHITSSDYDDFISTLRIARAAYHMTPGGQIPFNDLLQSLKRTKTCKKELWQQIQNAMQQP